MTVRIKAQTLCQQINTANAAAILWKGRRIYKDTLFDHLIENGFYDIQLSVDATGAASAKATYEGIRLTLGEE